MPVVFFSAYETLRNFLSLFFLKSTSECEVSYITLKPPRATGGAPFFELTPNDPLLSTKSYTERPYFCTRI